MSTKSLSVSGEKKRRKAVTDAPVLMMGLCPDNVSLLSRSKVGEAKL